jgi:hypothetical protein
VRKDLIFGERSGGSLPTAPANTRYAAPAPAALRNQRRVNLEPMAGTIHRK